MEHSCHHLSTWEGEEGTPGVQGHLQPVGSSKPAWDPETSRTQSDSVHAIAAVSAFQTTRESSTLSKWLKEALNSFICSWVMPFASLVRIWVSTSLMVLAMVVSSNSHPTRICYQGEGSTVSQVWEVLVHHCHKRRGTQLSRK